MQDRIVVFSIITDLNFRLAFSGKMRRETKSQIQKTRPKSRKKFDRERMMQRGVRKRNEDNYQINSLVPDPFETHRFIHLDRQQLSFGKEKNTERGKKKC